MANNQFSGASALLSHMLDGHHVSLLEAMILWCPKSKCRVWTHEKSWAYIARQRVPMAKILRRINQYCVVTPPLELPTRECS